MTPERYIPVPLNIVTTRKRWAKDPAFVESDGALADEFTALGELLHTRRRADPVDCELHTTPASKATTLRRSKAAAS